MIQNIRWKSAPYTCIYRVLNLEREKTGDVGNFHNTYVIHILKFMITRDNAFGHLLFDILLSIVYYGKQGLDTFDDGYICWWYLLTEVESRDCLVHICIVAKKCRLLWTCTGFVFNRVETKGGSVLYFVQAKSMRLLILKRIKGGRDKKVNTLQYRSWIINVSSSSFISFICFFSKPFFQLKRRFPRVCLNSMFRRIFFLF